MRGFPHGQAITPSADPHPLGGLSGALKGRKEYKKILLKFNTSFFDLAWSNLLFFLSLLSLPSSKSLFSSSWSLFVSILSSQADRPTLKNVGFMRAGARFSKNQGFGSKDALDGVLGLSWAHFGCSWGLLGGSFGAFAGFRWHLELSKLLIGFPSWPNCLFLFRLFFRSLLRSRCFPYLRASWCRF